MEKFILIVPSFDGIKYTINKNYLNIFKDCNIPYYILDYNINLLKMDKVCGILLTGGGDIGKKYLGEELHFKANDICEKRDEFEVNLLKKAYFSNIPTLGICRGAQIMNIAFGGTINQHIDGHLQKEARNLPTQNLFVKKNSEFYQIIGKEQIKVNSIHHQAIKKVAKGFSEIAIAEDGIIEGIELINSSKYFLGLQWHPEALFDDISKKIFESFLERVYNFIIETNYKK